MNKTIKGAITSLLALGLFGMVNNANYSVNAKARTPRTNLTTNRRIYRYYWSKRTPKILRNNWCQSRISGRYHKNDEEYKKPFNIRYTRDSIYLDNGNTVRCVETFNKKNKVNGTTLNTGNSNTHYTYLGRSEFLVTDTSYQSPVSDHMKIRKVLKSKYREFYLIKMHGRNHCSMWSINHKNRLHYMGYFYKQHMPKKLLQ